MMDRCFFLYGDVISVSKIARVCQFASEMPGSLTFNSIELGHSLYDHRPLCLNQDDYERVCQIPKKKGANFRDLPGVRVRPDNKVEWDPNVERKKVTSGKPLVPDYAMTFVKGSSSKPFGRLWLDETVPTVVTRAEPHNQAILHPLQDRVLTIRENARLQGFPDYYRLLGPIKERWIIISPSTTAMRLPLFPLVVLQLKKLKRIGDLLPKLPPPFPPPLSGRSFRDQIALFVKEKKAPSVFWFFSSFIVQAFGLEFLVVSFVFGCKVWGLFFGGDRAIRFVGLSFFFGFFPSRTFQNVDSAIQRRDIPES